MDRGAWWATVHGAAKELDTTEQYLSDPFNIKENQSDGSYVTCLRLHRKWQKQDLNPRSLSSRRITFKAI